jgi:hypothetical protein
MDTKTLVQLAEAYIAHTGRKLSTISTYSANDGKFLGGLKAGNGCTLRKAAVVLSWFDENWPQDLAWPAHIARPKTAGRTSKRAA